MMQPTVACIMLANGRPEMVARAVKSFRSQTYENKRLLIYDNQDLMTMPNLLAWSCTHPEDNIWVEHSPKAESIGALRNAANDHKYSEVEIICHWDSDDWSHPNRIAEQVALLQSSGAECVGYNEMLFWKTCQFCDCGRGNILPYCPDCGLKYNPSREVPTGEAWLYRASIPKYAIGTSMCYWRETWERHPFPDRSEGCDDLYWFNAGVKIVSHGTWDVTCADEYSKGTKRDPMMIASIHGGNTCSKIDPKAREWTRVPQWDNYAREAMKL